MFMYTINICICDKKCILPLNIFAFSTFIHYWNDNGMTTIQSGHNIEIGNKGSVTHSYWNLKIDRFKGEAWQELSWNLLLKIS